jgi:hypothetical protein
VPAATVPERRLEVRPIRARVMCVDDGPALTHLGAQDSLGEYLFAQDVSVSAMLSQLP